MKTCLGGVLVGTNNPGNDLAKPVWKRLLDITCIVLALPFLIPVFLLVSIIIKIVSPGPLLYRQDRIGYLGKKFTCLKFRSMKVNSDTTVHQAYLNQLLRSEIPMTKMDVKGDDRLIPFGSFLRSTGLDELPQLINVLRGEMSLVGPRPCTPYEMEHYLPWQMGRFETLPGITGLWQVSGKNRTTFKEMIQFDIYYAAKKSLWMDLKIMLLTFPVLAMQVIESKQKPARINQISWSQNL